MDEDTVVNCSCGGEHLEEVLRYLDEAASSTGSVRSECEEWFEQCGCRCCRWAIGALSAERDALGRIVQRYVCVAPGLCRAVPSESSTSRG